MILNALCKLSELFLVEVLAGLVRVRVNPGQFNMLNTVSNRPGLDRWQQGVKPPPERSPLNRSCGNFRGRGWDFLIHR
jgi:hypothetical protein